MWRLDVRATSLNMVQKTYIQTKLASFASRTLGKMIEPDLGKDQSDVIRHTSRERKGMPNIVFLNWVHLRCGLLGDL